MIAIQDDSEEDKFVNMWTKSFPQQSSASSSEDDSSEEDRFVNMWTKSTHQCGNTLFSFISLFYISANFHNE